MTGAAGLEGDGAAGEDPTSRNTNGDLPSTSTRKVPSGSPVAFSAIVTPNLALGDRFERRDRDRRVVGQRPPDPDRRRSLRKRRRGDDDRPGSPLARRLGVVVHGEQLGNVLIDRLDGAAAVREPRAQAVVAGHEIDPVGEVARVARMEEQSPLLAVESLAHRAEVGRDDGEPRELRFANREAERLPPERRHDQHVELRQDPRKLRGHVGAVEEHVAQPDRAGSQPVEVIAVVVERDRLAMDVQLEVRSPQKAERVYQDVRAFDGDHGADEADLPDGAGPAGDPAEGRRVESVRKRDDAVGVDREVQHPFPMERRRRDEHVREIQDVGEVAVELGERLGGEPAAGIQLGAMARAIAEDARPDRAEAVEADVAIHVLADVELFRDPRSTRADRPEVVKGHHQWQPAGLDGLADRGREAGEVMDVDDVGLERDELALEGHVD